jgi:O-antigen/teichoic acid export membrane protein
VMMLISLNSSIPRYVLEHTAGLAALGIFAAVAYITIAGGTVMNAVGQSMSPRLSRAIAARDAAALRALAVRLLGVAFALGTGSLAIVVVAGRPLLASMYGARYAGAHDVLVIVTLAAAIGYVGSALGYLLTAARRFAVQAPLFAVVVAATAATSVVLIPSLGLAGAGWSLTVGAGVQVTASAALLHRRIAWCLR